MQHITDTKSLLAHLHMFFSNAFMDRYTNFDTFDAFCCSSAVIVNWWADAWHYSQVLLDLFVCESTVFSSWEEMVTAAVAFHTESQETLEQISDP